MLYNLLGVWLETFFHQIFEQNNLWCQPLAPTGTHQVHVDFHPVSPPFPHGQPPQGELRLQSCEADKITCAGALVSSRMCHLPFGHGISHGTHVWSGPLILPWAWWFPNQKPILKNKTRCRVIVVMAHIATMVLTSCPNLIVPSWTCTVPSL